MTDLIVSRLKQYSPQKIGIISTDSLSFAYDDKYLSSPSRTPLSCSLPLRKEPFTLEEFRPYFEGLLAEGTARQALAAKLQLPEENWLGMLSVCGKECIGDILVTSSSEVIPQEHAYKPIDIENLRDIFLNLANTAEENTALRLSLAGAQNKTALAHNPSMSITEGWFQPVGLAATTHILKASQIRDIPEVEFLCMKAAEACGINVANVFLLDIGNPVLAVERFDRKISESNEDFEVTRLHQEDLAQAFGITPGSKYAEIKNNSIASITSFLKVSSKQPARDIAQFARMLCFTYLIGDCDAHLKNFSVLQQEENLDNNKVSQEKNIQDERNKVMPTLSLSPAYDLVSTTYFPRYSRDMAMNYGGLRTIDEISARSFEQVAFDLSVTKAALQGIARVCINNTHKAIQAAGDGKMGAVLESTPYVADDLIEDILPREAILEEFCAS